jgi:NTP pyrophosphatase (non-canonical NTP hydrolase)
MDNKRYRKAIERTMPDMPREEKLKMCAMGIAGEIGEIVDSLKKSLYQGHPIDTEKITLEFGDAEFYLQHLKKELGISDEMVYIRNIQKLYSRYPNGFSKEASLNREL